MSELLAWDGEWTIDRLHAMEPVAVEREVKRERAFFNAALAAIASVFSKGDVGKKYSESLEKVLKVVRGSQRQARGGRAPSKHAEAAQKLLDTVLSQKGIKKL